MSYEAGSWDMMGWDWAGGWMGGYIVLFSAFCLYLSSWAGGQGRGFGFLGM